MKRIGRKPKTAMRGNSSALRRLALIGESAGLNTTDHDDLRFHTMRAINRVKETIAELRKSQGLSLPKFDADWDSVSTSVPSPATTIQAYQGERNCVRVTLHLRRVGDDTEILELEQSGISHLIGLEIDQSKKFPSWLTKENGGMLSIVSLPINFLESTLHDIFLDMALVHTKGKPWSGIKEKLSAHQIAVAKREFIRSRLFDKDHPLGVISESIYAPLSSLASVNFPNTESQGYGLEIVEVWTAFAIFLAKKMGAELPTSSVLVVDQILRNHRHGGQISPKGLEKEIARLEEGHYCLFLLERKPLTSKKKAQVGGFFERNSKNLHTQVWIVKRRQINCKLEDLLLIEEYITKYPFYLGPLQ